MFKTKKSIYFIVFTLFLFSCSSQKTNDLLLKVNDKILTNNDSYIDFNIVPIDSSGKFIQLNIQNLSKTDIFISKNKMVALNGSDANDFSFDLSLLKDKIEKNNNVNIIIKFHPVNIGIKVASLSLRNFIGDKDIKINLIGTAVPSMVPVTSEFMKWDLMKL